LGGMPQQGSAGIPAATLIFTAQCRRTPLRYALSPAQICS
jgi:hypothetical protein